LDLNFEPADHNV